MKETVEENTSTTERVFQDRQYQVLLLSFIHFNITCEFYMMCLMHKLIKSQINVVIHNFQFPLGGCCYCSDNEDEESAQSYTADN